MALVGNLIHGTTSLCEQLEKEVPGRRMFSHADVVRSTLGLLCLGKSDLEPAAGTAGDDWFQDALDIQKVPSQETISTWVTRHHEKRTYRFRLVIRVTERIWDSKGQILIRPDIKLEGWWSSLSVHEDEVIRLSENRGLIEPIHSEIKSDLNLERLPFGKFATHALVLTLGGLADNILRILGQNGLLGHFSPVRHRAKRRHVKTVIQELIYPGGA